MRPKILIVDDEQDVREYLAKLLGRKNFDTIMASSGQECLKAAETEMPDVILLDISTFEDISFNCSIISSIFVFILVLTP